MKERLPITIETRSNNRVRSLLSISVIHELVANAHVHRDYRDPSSSYLNIIGDSELEVCNPGVLPSPKVTPDTMHLPHPSVPITRRIARAFFLAGLIEQWGEGTRRVWQQVTELGYPPPQWYSERGTVRAVLTMRTV